MLSRQDPQRMNDIAQIRQQIDLLTQRIITFRIQQQEFSDVVTANLMADRDRACEVGNGGNSRNYCGGCGIDFYLSSYVSSNKDDGGYDGPPIFDEEIDNTIMEVVYNEPPNFDEEIGDYNGPPIFDTEGDDIILMVGYEEPSKFDEEIDGYDGPPIFDMEGDYTISLIDYAKSLKFDTDECGYDRSLIFDKKIEVGTYVVGQYYHALQILPHVLNYMRTECTTTHFSESWNDGVLVMVSDLVVIKDLNGLKIFVKSCFLTSREKGYFVLNDLFHSLDEEQMLQQQHPITCLLHSNHDSEINCSSCSTCQNSKYKLYLIFSPRPPRAPPWFDNSLISLPIRERIVSTPERMMEI